MQYYGYGSERLYTVYRPTLVSRNYGHIEHITLFYFLGFLNYWMNL